jgi:hypothetical protein
VPASTVGGILSLIPSAKTEKPEIKRNMAKNIDNRFILSLHPARSISRSQFFYFIG